MVNVYIKNFVFLVLFVRVSPLSSLLCEYTDDTKIVSVH